MNGHAMQPGVFDFLLSTKYLVFVLLAGTGTALLLARRTRKPYRLAALGLSLVLLGGLLGLAFEPVQRALGLHPSPMCAMTKLFAFGWLKGRWPVPMLAMFFAMLLLSLIGRKLFCGWVCPMGALQELLFSIPGVKKLKNLPFKLTNSVRAALLALYAAGLLGFGVITYEWMNAFELLHWDPKHSITAAAVAVVLASLFYFRPFCYLVCPIGLLSWVLEPFTPLAVRVDRGDCIDCGACVEESPCPAVGPLIEGKGGWLPDCVSCGACMDSCPESALRFGLPAKDAGDR